MREFGLATPPWRGRGGFERSTLGLGLVVSLVGCGRRDRAPVPGFAVLAASPAVLAPEASPGERATLRLGAPPSTKGTGLSAMEFEVGVIRATDGADVILKLVSGGEVLERESYEARAQAFRLRSTGDDAFAPPLDLIRYPVREGAAWDWKGEVFYAGASREAHAWVTISQEGGDVRSDVALSVAADPNRPELRRGLSFWFRKGHGVVRRAFGDVSSRRPLGEPWRP